MLDIVRAARQADHRLSKTVAIVGGSQGGHAALWAASLARAYTPELRVKATVAFAPVSHLDEQLPLVPGLTTPGGGLSATVAIILRGIAAATPSLDIASLLTEKAAALSPRLLTDCLTALSTADSFGGLSPAELEVPGADLTPWLKALDHQDTSHLRIATPVLIEQGTKDNTVFKPITDRLTRELRANGVPLTYKTYPGVDHTGVQVRSQPTGDAYKYVRDRLG